MIYIIQLAEINGTWYAKWCLPNLEAHDVPGQWSNYTDAVTDAMETVTNDWRLHHGENRNFSVSVMFCDHPSLKKKAG